MKQLQEHGADAAVRRCLGRDIAHWLTDELHDSDGDVLYRRRAAQADPEEARRRVAEREAWRAICRRCGAKLTDERWEETTGRDAWKAGNLSVCGACHADDVARQEAAAEASWELAPVQSEPEGDRDQEPGKPAAACSADGPCPDKLKATLGKPRRNGGLPRCQGQR
ncbi:hypothetical protein J7E93_36560 [Streptomyces sp. ISL-36]|uniref:hypothetical protein n=1 Tax=Streptomyces sp. ISL-36 TaxID=2819182 RepID=UPI001BEC11F4|nr:hypothetical protein [Streptomyces sp. ISL-36]MBT2445498.1 hypothetical protein [Streptomyces sp. ISL-36]